VSRPRDYQVDVLLMAVAVSWGSTYWVAKELVGGGGVLGMLSIRMVVTALVLALLLRLAGRRLSRASVGLGMLFGLTLTAVFAFETFGIAGTTATNAGLIISLTMVITPVVEATWQRARVPRAYLIGGLVACLGVGLLSTNGNLAAPRLGDWLILTAAVLRAVHVTVVKRRSGERDVDDLSLTVVQMATCGVLFTVAGLAVGDTPAAYLAGMDTGDMWRMAYLVLACTVFAFYIQMWAVRRTSASRVSLLLGTEPIYAALIGVVFAGDQLTWLGWLGLALVLVSVSSVQFLTSAKAAAPTASSAEVAAAARRGEPETVG